MTDLSETEIGILVRCANNKNMKLRLRQTYDRRRIVGNLIERGLLQVTRSGKSLELTSAGCAAVLSLEVTNYNAFYPLAQDVQQAHDRVKAAHPVTDEKRDMHKSFHTTDWETAHRTLDNALKALEMLSGDESAAGLVRDTLTYLHNERRRLEADNDRLRHSTEDHRTGEQKTLTVAAGDGSYTRTQPVIVMTWTCAICGASHSREQLPGNTPKYCPPGPDEKQSDCQKIAARRRLKAHREQKRQTK